jgi:hypothetical protein
VNLHNKMRLDTSISRRNLIKAMAINLDQME